MPPEKHLEMPTQSLRRWSRSRGARPSCDRSKLASPGWRASSSSAAALLLTAYGTYEMYQVVSVSRTTVLQWVLVALFTVNFSWIAVAFTSALLGFPRLLRTAAASGASRVACHSRTAVVMPVYNEQTARTFAALEAIHELSKPPASATISIISSCPTRPIPTPGSPRSAPSWPCARALGPDARLYYRHRPKNHHRKAGNIARFRRNAGAAHYEHMLVLDADSLMTGECIVRLAAAMEADPDAGIIQTLPLIINRNTLFARAPAIRRARLRSR